MTRFISSPASKQAAQLAIRSVVSGCCLLWMALDLGASTIQIGATRDTTVYQSNPNNGAGGGPGIFVGTNAQSSPRRGTIAFDISKIPSNATITDAQVRLVIGQIAGSGGGAVGFSNPTIELHKLLVDWGEANTGASMAQGLGGAAQGNPAQNGDATWNARFFDPSTPTLWSLPGGAAGVDYAAGASASLVQSNNVNDVSLWLSTPALVADVQSWVNAPSTNNGWMLINTNETAAQTFRAFYSRNYNPVPTVPGLEDLFPKLLVTYTVPEPPAGTLVAIGLVVGGMSQWAARRRRVAV